MRGRTRREALTGTFRRSVPAGRSRKPLTTSSAASTSPKAGPSRSRSRAPASVGATLRVLRLSSRTPSLASSRLTASLKPEALVPLARAASRKPPVRATATNAVRSSRSAAIVRNSERPVPIRPYYRTLGGPLSRAPDTTEETMADSNKGTGSTSKIAIVTGGSRGLGRNTVLSLAKRGVDSIFTYNSNRAEADKVVALVEEAGAKAGALQLDTGNTGSFDGFVANVRKALAALGAERFDFLVNNAGNSHNNSFEKTTEAEFDTIYNVHLKGVFFLTQKLLPLINDGGRIVNLSSGLTRMIMPGRATYGTMKAAVETLTKYMAKELAPRRIAVNVVAPGAIATDFSGGFVRDNPEVNKHIAEMTALGRVGLPDDIGPMIASLLSEDNRWVNAQRIEVSGGMQI